jgi:hypothetical protein
MHRCTAEQENITLNIHVKMVDRGKQLAPHVFFPAKNREGGKDNQMTTQNGAEDC